MELTAKERRILEANKKYWATERFAKAQARLTQKNIRQIEKKLADYYAKTMEFVIRDFEFTHEKILNAMDNGKKPTPADLYKLDRYWEMQGQLKRELQKLGDKQILLLSKEFEKEWGDIYDLISLPSGRAFSTIADTNAAQMINAIWCADGKSWSERVWGNTKRLQDALNDGLIEILLGGKTTKELKQKLKEEFEVSFSRADALVRTEMNYIQTQSALQRYKDAGITEVEILADKDERRCEICGKLHKTRYNINGAIPVPAHPRCRCIIIPVIE